MQMLPFSPDSLCMPTSSRRLDWGCYMSPEGTTKPQTLCPLFFLLRQRRNHKPQKLRVRGGFYRMESCCANCSPNLGLFPCLEGRGARQTLLPGTGIPKGSGKGQVWWDCMGMDSPIKVSSPEEQGWNMYSNNVGLE